MLVKGATGVPCVITQCSNYSNLFDGEAIQFHQPIEVFALVDVNSLRSSDAYMRQ